MSNDIKAGDLVMVVKANYCCGNNKSLGIPFTVIGLPDYDLSECSCGHIQSSEGEVKLSNGNCCEISRLKKIPPLSDLEDVSTHRQDLIPNEQENETT